MSRYGRDLALLGLLAALPVVAHAPAWTQGRLLGPGDGAALHFPLRVAVWRAYEAREVPSWNPGIFSGTPLLASYRPAALHPLTAALSWWPEFAAFQLLVLVSLSLAATLLYLYCVAWAPLAREPMPPGFSFPWGHFSAGGSATPPP